MTSNERKIVNFLREAKRETHIQLIARQTGLSGDYARLLGRSLERAGYVRFADANLCHLLTKGRARVRSGGTNSGDVSPGIATAGIAAGDAAAAIPAASAREKESAVLQKAEGGAALTFALNLKGISEKEKEKLAEAGYKSVEDLAKAPINKLIQGTGINLRKAANWINQARRRTGVINEKG